MQPFTLLIKPSGSDCNIDCHYCFYKNRCPEIGQGHQRMTYETLERMVKDYMELGFGQAGFAWQGGEPTLMGLDFFKRVVEFQKKYGGDGQMVSNALQTNAILIDDEWGPFLAENKFLVGVSIDGPKGLHDHYRKDLGGHGTFDRVYRAIEKCKEYDVEFNTLTLLNNVNVTKCDEVMDFFIDEKIKYLQFIPCVETDPATGEVAEFSITAEQFGDFLCRAFDRWVEVGPENLSIRDFDSVLSYCATGRHTICTFSKRCSDYIVIEHKGDAYCCDFFVTPEWYLGNIFETNIAELAACGVKRRFAKNKQNLCTQCLICRHLDVCRGGCMKDRVATSNDGKRISHFCEAYKKFFDYSMPKFMQMAAEINSRNQQ